MLADVPADGGRGGLRQSLLFGAQHVQQLAAPRDKRRQRLRGLVGERARRRLDAGPKQREHSRIELRRKLARHRQKLAERAQASLLEGVAPALPVPEEGEIDALLDWLASKDLLSVERFVETRIQARASRFGNLRIRQELAQHGVDIDAQTAQQLKASEFDRARAVWLKRFGAPAADPAGRARQMRFLAARGFASDVVRRVVAGSDPHADDEAA